MLKMLQRDYEQNIEDIKNVFPNCHCLINETCGVRNTRYLIAVSEEPTTNKKLCALAESLRGTIHVRFAGIYKNGGAVGVIDFIEATQDEFQAFVNKVPNSVNL